MRLLKTCVLVALLGSLQSCETIYQPEEDYSGISHGGYVDTRINANTVIVSFSGNTLTPQRTVEAYLLYRCAQVTVENGYDYFVVTSTTGLAMNLEIATRNATAAVTSPGKLYRTNFTTTHYKSYRATPTAMPPYGETVDTQDLDPHGAVAVIKMFSGRIPENLPHAFSATDVIAHLGPSTF
jgi:hypothetical protein